MIKIEDYIEKYLSKWDFFGVISVMCKEKVIFEKAYGYSCIEFDLKNTINTRFSLASMTKQFTAFAIMQLNEKHLINIDEPANKYLPLDIRIDERITIHHLLSHTSGLHNFYNFDDNFFGVYNRNNYSKMEFFNKYINQDLSFNPGERFDYNNSGYNLLAWIIENVSGMEYYAYLNESIFIPLNMTNTCVDDGSVLLKNKAYNYVMDKDKYIRSPYFNEKYSIGAGALISNCEDLYKWYHCLKNKKILLRESYNRFFNENLNGYCYGLERSLVHGNMRYSHGGDHFGILTFMQNFFDEDICIIILSNNECINQYKLGNAITNILHGIKPDDMKLYKEIVLDEKFASEYEGIYLDGKIQLSRINDRWYFVRFNGNLHISIYPIGNHQFMSRFQDRMQPYSLYCCDDGIFEFFGYKKTTNNIRKRPVK